jgi:hypothetical protein
MPTESTTAFIEEARRAMGDLSHGFEYDEVLDLLRRALDHLATMTAENARLNLDYGLLADDLRNLHEWTDLYMAERDRLARMLDTAVCEMAEMESCWRDASHCAAWFGEESDEDVWSMCAGCYRQALEEVED